MEGKVALAAKPVGGNASVDSQPALVVSDISKRYGVVKALDTVSVEVARGELRALVGENGSGKSTFVGIVSGAVEPDRGSVVIAGAESREHKPWESQRNGALAVFQDGSMVPEFTVAQNLYLGTPAAHRPPYRKAEGWAREALGRFGLDEIKVETRSGELTPGLRQLIEIIRAIMAQPDVLLLDEATSALDAAAVDVALGLMRKAADAGSAVVFVTHRLSEVFRIADRISVLRDGVLQGTHETAAVDQSKVVELMAGRSIDLAFPDRALSGSGEGTVLSVQRLAGDAFGPIDLAVSAGEIVGIAGANGNGQAEMLRGLAGINITAGQIEVSGHSVATYQDAVKAGAILLSSDRRNESLLAPLAVRENVSLGVLGDLATVGTVRWPREKQFVSESIDRFGIRTGSSETVVTALSGGNQQKVALARVLATRPKVLIIDEPTLGLDVGSRMDIYGLLRSSARDGIAVVIVSSDAAELAGLCDRIVVLSRGKIVDEMPGEAATEERIVHAFTGAGHVGALESEVLGMTESKADARTGSGMNRLGRVLRHHETTPRLFLLALLVIGLGAYARSANSNFLSQESLYNIFLLAVPLSAVAAGEFVVLFTRGIDVSVGVVMGLTIAVMSFVVTSGSFAAGLFISLGIALGVGLLVGLTNSTLIEKFRISPVITTVATLSVVQGIGLLLRPTAAGTLSQNLLNGLTAKVWAVPWALIVLIVVFVLGDVVLRSTGPGLRMRAVGLNPDFAFRLGINTSRIRQLSYVGCSILAAVAGVLLAGQVGVGDSTVGNGYTLIAIAAPVLGGASLLGGYGTLIGCLLGAILLTLAQSLPSSLGVSTAISPLLTGGLTLLALLIYTRSAGTALRGYARSFARKAGLQKQGERSTRRATT